MPKYKKYYLSLLPAHLGLIRLQTFMYNLGFGLRFFWGGLLKFRCTKCVNFSCIFNRVPKNTVTSQ